MSVGRAILAAVFAAVVSFPGLAHAAGTVVASPTPSSSDTIVPSPMPDGTVVVIVSVKGRGFVTSTPPGFACPPLCSVSFAPGTTLVLHGQSAKSWKLKGWGGLCGGKKSNCTVVIPASAQPIPVRVKFRHLQPNFSFWPRVARYIETRGDRVGVAVFDRRSMRMLMTNGDAQFGTASTVKAQILGTLLARAQAEGRELTTWEMDNAIPMIERSDNGAATNLWQSVGGASGVRRFDESIGMDETDPNSAAWGLTLVTARDSVKLMRTFMYPSHRLTTHYREVALSLFESVDPSQRWGISGGVRGANIAIKNGWLPHGSGWIINSIGGVWGAGRDYVIAVLTDGNTSEGYGIETIQGVARIVWSGMRA